MENRISVFTGIRPLAAVLTLAAIGCSGARAEETAAEIQALHREIRLLEQKLDALEAREAARDQKASQPTPAAPTNAGTPALESPVAVTAPRAPAGTTPKVTADDRGFRIASADGGTAVHLGGLVQFDSRTFFDDGGGLLNNGFLLRRARVITDGTFDKIYTFQFVPDFGSTSVTIFDANAGINLSDQLQLKFGKFKAPVGLEMLQGDPFTLFNERSVATNLVPNRDLGAQVGGTFLGKVITYQAGIFNGVADGANTTNQDFDNDKDFDARVIVQPFIGVKDSVLSGLGVGVAATTGREKGTAALTAGYKTDGQQTFFKYNAAVVADGENWRVSPQAFWFAGPFGAIAEYVDSTANVRPTATGAKQELRNTAWEASASWVVTGENASYTGVTPSRPFNWQNGSWGAFQVVARYGDLKIDNRAFPLFAATASNAQEDATWGAGVNWYLNTVVTLKLDGFLDHFDNPANPSTTQILRQDERSLITRVQLNF